MAGAATKSYLHEIESLEKNKFQFGTSGIKSDPPPLTPHVFVTMQKRNNITRPYENLLKCFMFSVFIDSIIFFYVSKF